MSTNTENKTLTPDIPSHDTPDVVTKSTPTIDYDRVVAESETNESDPLEQLNEQVQENLRKLDGLPGAHDILNAFKATDSRGKRMTVTEFRKSFFNVAANEATHGYAIMATMEPAVSLEQCGGYTTVVLKFDYARNPEMNRIWHMLEDYGTEQAELEPDAEEIPVLSITVVPMLLGGQYGMVAHDPIFYHMQPSDAMQDYCDEIRIVFEPDSVAFLRDESFTSEGVVEEVKRELAAEKLQAEEKAKLEAEENAYQERRNHELEEYRDQERRERYHFTASKSLDERFTDSTGKRKK